MPSSHYSRRRFLGASASLAAGAFTGPNLLLKGQDAAGKKLNLPGFGAGKGLADTGMVTSSTTSSPWWMSTKSASMRPWRSAENRRQSGESTPPTPKMFTDFRKMFDTMANEIDGVIISTPDHTHYIAAMWALKHKKHVCVQKPLCNYISEVRGLHKAAKEAGVVTQMGNQGRTMEGQRLAKEWIEQGVIGTLKEIRLWTNRPIWPQGPIKKKLHRSARRL